MITTPGARRVLCFGDSNTYGTCLLEEGVVGTDVGDPDFVRLDAEHRWPGVLQRLLGEGYEVIEEALNGRTTDLDYEDRPGGNGRAYFVPCLLSHGPLDVVVVMLGVNDLKQAFGRTPTQVADALGGYVDDVVTYAADAAGRTPTTVLVGPTRLDDQAPRYPELVGEGFDPGAAERFRVLSTEIRRVAAERGVPFVDAADVARPGGDGLHLTWDSHRSLAELVAAQVMIAPQG